MPNGGGARKTSLNGIARRTATRNRQARQRRIVTLGIAVVEVLDDMKRRACEFESGFELENFRRYSE